MDSVTLFIEDAETLDARAVRMQRAADRQVPAVAAAIGDLLARARDALDIDVLEGAVARLDVRTLLGVLPDLMLLRVAKADERPASIDDVYRSIFTEVGGAVHGDMVPRLDLINAAAVRYASRESAALVRGIDAQARRTLRRIVSRALAGDLTPRRTALLIRETVYLSETSARSVERYMSLLLDRLDAGESLADAHRSARVGRPLAPRRFRDASTVEDLIGRYAARHRAWRAETIARTETMRAANAGQYQVWLEAESAGLLDGDATVLEWYATPDDRTCTICMGLHGQQVVLGSRGEFVSETGLVTAYPPAHPLCRCTLAVVATTAPAGILASSRMTG